MANPEHVAKLQEGVEAWNQWRKREPETPPDLSGINLDKATLYQANFNQANFIGASFVAANLDGSSFWGADCAGADFDGAHMFHVNLTEANLSHATLRSSQLFGARLFGTNVKGCDFEGASIGRTLLVDANLAEAKNLETCSHQVASVMDHRTLAKSGPLPLAFLRGVGLPDALIEYLPSLLNQPIQFYSVFISYSKDDQAFAERLYADLQNRGVRCWFAPHDMQRGKKIHQQIDDAIRRYDKLLLILSESSMNSPWVKTEIANARARERDEARQMLFPISVVPFDDTRKWKCFDADTGIDSAREIREYLIADFSRWKEHDSYSAEFEKLVRDLKADQSHSAVSPAGLHLKRD